jgi:hypothetical protein
MRQVLIQWRGEPPSAATWEDVEDFVQRYPTFQPADELFVQGGRDVMWGKWFTRRSKKAGTASQESG